MDDKTLVERLLVSDFYGYQGRKEVEAANTLRREAATRIEALEAAAWKVLAYDQLLRKVGEIRPGVLLAGDMPNVDAVYDDMVKTCVNALSGKALEGSGND